MTRIKQAKLKYSYTVQANLLGSSKYKNHKPPGQHGNSLRKKKLTEYGVQVRETKKLSTFYNVKHRSLKRKFEQVTKMKGNTMNNLIGALESLLSSCVLRAKFANSIYEAKQLVSHGHILVNGKKVDISSYIVKPGDVISLQEGMRENHHVLTAISSNNKVIPPHIEGERFQAKFIRVPNYTEDLFFCPMNISAVIEFLSR